MPVYLLQVCHPLIAIFKKVEAFISRFFWGSTKHNKKLHWSTWPPLCLPVKEGRLGFRQLSDTCEAFNFKLWFKFRQQDYLWARCVMLKYCRSGFPESLIIRNTDSMIWKRMAGVHSVGQRNFFGK